MSQFDIDDVMFQEDTGTSIDFGKVFSKLKSNWKKILYWCVGGFAVGCVVAICTPRKYVVTSELAPELSSSATSRLTSMASMLGYSSSMLGTTDAVYPMVYPDLVHSSVFLADLFDVPVTFVHKKKEINTTLYDYVLNYQKTSLLMSVLSFPMKIVGWVSDIFSEEEKEEVSVDPFYFTKEQARVAKIISKSIDAKIDKKTLVVTISVKMQDKVICAEIARVINQNIQKCITSYRTEKAIMDCEYYEALYNEAKDDYFAAQEEYSEYVDSHQDLSFSRFMIESERLKDESALKFQLYNSMAQQLQQAKAKVQLDTPAFVEIIPPSVPDKSANSRKRIALAFAFLGLIAGSIIVIFKQ